MWSASSTCPGTSASSAPWSPARSASTPVVLVVAADEGVMPQTREHLDICGLLGRPRRGGGADQVRPGEPELRELATLELRETLRGTFLAEAPIVPCSAETGEGLPALVAAIAQVLAAAPGRDDAAGCCACRWTGCSACTALAPWPPARCGRGSCGSATSWCRCRDAKSEQLALAKVRGLHVHGAAVSEAVAGQRTAVNLTLPLAARGPRARRWCARGRCRRASFWTCKAAASAGRRGRRCGGAAGCSCMPGPPSAWPR